MVVDASYEFTDSELLLADPVIKRKGHWLRLGHLHNGEIINSEGWIGPHQPFKHESGDYFTFEAQLYRDGKVFVEPWEGYTECGNAWVDGDRVYFEILRKGCVAPDGWEIWWTSVKPGNGCGKVVDGANPCIYDGKLYYGLWTGVSFEYAIADRLD